MGDERLANLVMVALACAIDEDYDGAFRAVSEVGEQAGPGQFQMYAACVAFAETGRQALVKLYGDQAPDLARDQYWSVEQLPSPDGAPDAQDLFAVRFIVAVANNDKPQAMALWQAALRASSAEYIASVAAVLTAAAGLVRKAFL
ncbi:hypothetical protein AQJ30_15815 [Streptomyces longwoodensis]|uniref:Uncharacterized protein n=1 Tax=Streptomyces longwoodensis TaxID=68231 RepID=A0A117QN95_9ACTN|nr:hypothetical protein [Streptomyces longwoodensis]KUN37749.1 hypothetical protein AQJ30_15815 [Streptomyces longwoodensis]